MKKSWNTRLQPWPMGAISTSASSVPAKTSRSFGEWGRSQVVGWGWWLLLALDYPPTSFVHVCIMLCLILFNQDLFMFRLWSNIKTLRNLVRTCSNKSMFTTFLHSDDHGCLHTTNWENIQGESMCTLQLTNHFSSQKLTDFHHDRLAFQAALWERDCSWVRPSAACSSHGRVSEFEKQASGSTCLIQCLGISWGTAHTGMPVCDEGEPWHGVVMVGYNFHGSKFQTLFNDKRCQGCLHCRTSQ